MYAGARAVVGAAILVGRVGDHCVAAGQAEVDRGRGRGERERENDAAHGCEAGDGADLCQRAAASPGAVELIAVTESVQQKAEI